MTTSSLEGVVGLTIWQPYTSLIANEVKRIETRSYSTRFRGPLLIHAAKRWDRGISEDCRRISQVLFDHCWPGTDSAIAALPWRDTLGCVLAVARLADCVQSQSLDDWSQCENAFGNLSPGRWAWKIADVQPLARPVPWKGAQGLWPVTDELRDLIIAALDNRKAFE